MTGSSYLLDTGKTRVMVDMGMFQGEGAEMKNPKPIEVEIESVDGLILTHAHLDHCGRLPMLFKDGKFRGNIWTMPPTIELSELVMHDSAHLMLDEVRRAGMAPLYETTQVEQVLEKFVPVEYEAMTRISDDVSFKLLDAGHILGSASVLIEVKDSNGSRKNIVFSGDLGNTPSPIVGMIDEPRFADVVIMESTYGDRLHEPRGKEEKVIAELSQEVERTKGTFLMPAFSLERTQELLQIFDKLKKSKAVSDQLLVYLDTPMGLRATNIYKQYSRYFNDATREIFARDDPFDFPGLVISGHHDQSERIDTTDGAKVIIAGSGMMSGGRIVHHAAKWLPDPKTILLFTGFQAKGTRGRHIVDGEKRLVIDGKLTEVNAKIVSVESMSGHADQNQLMDWLKQIQGVKKVILTHGEDPAREVIGKRIADELKLPVEKPYLNDWLEV